MFQTKTTRKWLTGPCLVCFFALSQFAYAALPDGKAVDECIEQSYKTSAFISGMASFMLDMATTAALNKAAGQKVIDKNDRISKAKDAATESSDAVANEDYLIHYSYCMRIHPEWHMKSHITRRDFLDDSEKPTVTDDTAFIIDNLDGKSELEFGESNVITAKIRIHAPDKQGQKLNVRHKLIFPKPYGFTKLVENIPFPGKDEKEIDLIDGVFTYRFDLTVPPQNEKTNYMAGQELIYEMGLYQSGNLVDRQILPFSIITDIKDKGEKTPEKEQ